MNSNVVSLICLSLGTLAATPVHADSDRWRFNTESGAGIAHVDGDKGGYLEYRCAYDRYENTVSWWDQFENLKESNQPQSAEEAPDELQCGVVLVAPAGGCHDSGLQVIEIRTYPFQMIGEFGCLRRVDRTYYTFFSDAEEKLREPLMSGHFVHFDVGEKYTFKLKGSYRAISAARNIGR